MAGSACEMAGSYLKACVEQQMRVECEYCGTSLMKHGLKRHQRSRKCLQAQGVCAQEQTCQWCNTKFVRTDNLQAHLKTCSFKFAASFQSTEQELKTQVNKLTSRLEQKEAEVMSLQNIVDDLENTIKQKDIEIKVLRTTPTIVNNNIDNSLTIKVDKYVVQRHAKDNFVPLTEGLLRECLSVPVDITMLLKGPEAIARLILETSLSGQNKVACTDGARAIALWKDIDHSITEDRQLAILMPRLVRPLVQPYRDAWLPAWNTIDNKTYMRIGNVIQGLENIANKEDVKSRLYTGIRAAILRANCDLSFMLEEEDEDEYVDHYVPSETD